MYNIFFVQICFLFKISLCILTLWWNFPKLRQAMVLLMSYIPLKLEGYQFYHFNANHSNLLFVSQIRSYIDTARNRSDHEFSDKKPLVVVLLQFVGLIALEDVKI